MKYENTFVREVKEKNITEPSEILNWYRNLYHTEDNHTEHGIVAYAINDFFADVVPKSEVEKFAEDIKLEFYREFDEIIPSIMADKIDELKKKYTEGKQ